MWLIGPRRKNWVVLASFSPYLYSGTLLSHPFGLQILLTLTLGSRDYFLPESPPPGYRRSPDSTEYAEDYPPMNHRDPCALCLYNYPPPVNPRGQLHIIAICTFI